MKIGIFGGTFDPVHLGHMIIAREALERLGLSELWFVPAGNPWMKDEWKISPPGYRLKMLELSIRGSPAFKISHVDLKRPGLSYTVDTLKDIKGETGAGDSLYFIMGIDSLKSFPTWKEPGTVISLCTLVSVPRPGSGKTLRVEILEKKVPGIREKVIFLPGPEIGINSTDIRQRIKEGRSIRYLVLPEVEVYIKRHGLYA